MRKALIVAALLALAGAAGWYWTSREGEAPSWRTVELSRGPVQQVVSATGILETTTSVDVGTQVSGIISEILVDFNDRVSRGQVLARIDTALLEADVESAAARVAEAEANRLQSQLEHARVVDLHGRGAATQQELESAQAALSVAEAQLRSAQVALSRARRNLAYATITSPIDGTVIQRSVEPGQTVSASLSAPTLFILAGDLAQMQILARVDETDIGQVKPGQKAEFTVPAWPDRTFEGTVRQVRLESVVEQNVVTYTVVVDAPNPENALLPGMTATVEFVVAEVEEALCAPNAALRFRPDATVSVLGAAEEAAAGPPPGAASNGSGGPPGGGGGPPGGHGGNGGRGGRNGGRPTTATLYTAEGAALKAWPVKIGLRSSACTEVSGEGLSEGMALVSGVEKSENGASTSPFAPKAPARH